MHDEVVFYLRAIAIISEVDPVVDLWICHASIPLHMGVPGRMILTQQIVRLSR
jgi:hypothetical protein